MSNNDLIGNDNLSDNGWGSITVPGKSNTSNKTLAWQVWKDKEDRRLAAEALAKSNTAESDLKTNTSDYYNSGTWKDSFGGQRTAANTAAGTASGAIDTNLADNLSRISGAYGDATKTTTGAYDDLINYLTQNPNNPYAGQSVSSGQVGNDMSQLMQAYGLDTNPTQQYLGATNASNDSTAQQFNNLLQVLSKMSTSSDASRMTEARSGSANALSALAGMNADNVTGANNAASAAKNQITQDLLAQISGIDANQSNEGERLKQLLITLGVNPTPPAAPAADDWMAELAKSLAGLNPGGMGFGVR